MESTCFLIEGEKELDHLITKKSLWWAIGDATQILDLPIMTNQLSSEFMGIRNIIKL
jgi:hypothetical protein